MHTVITLVAGSVLIIAAYVFFWSAPREEIAEPSNPGTYHYQCDGFTFAMTPSVGVESVTLVPAPGAPFFRTTLVTTGTARFEGGGIVLVGAGEEVTLQMEQGTYRCAPLPSSELAPWNWGDAGEGSGSRPDLARIVTESIAGRWQSSDDATFIRSFAEDGTIADYSGIDVVSRGTWRVFTSTSGITAPFPLDPDTAYIRVEMPSIDESIQHFRLVALTPESLELVYMERGGSLRFMKATD